MKRYNETNQALTTCNIGDWKTPDIETRKSKADGGVFHPQAKSMCVLTERSVSWYKAAFPHFLFYIPVPIMQQM